MRTIKIEQETPIPGTDYVLEAGDKIRVNPSKERELSEKAVEVLDRELPSFTTGKEIDSMKNVESLALSRDAGISMDPRGEGVILYIADRVENKSYRIRLSDSEMRLLKQF